MNYINICFTEDIHKCLNKFILKDVINIICDYLDNITYNIYDNDYIHDNHQRSTDNYQRTWGNYKFAKWIGKYTYGSVSSKGVSIYIYKNYIDVFSNKYGEIEMSQSGCLHDNYNSIKNIILEDTDLFLNNCCGIRVEKIENFLKLNRYIKITQNNIRKIKSFYNEKSKFLAYDSKFEQLTRDKYNGTCIFEKYSRVFFIDNYDKITKELNMINNIFIRHNVTFMRE